MLQTLKAAGLNTAILSNGSPDMLDGAVQSAGIEILLDDNLSVQSVGIFKPDSRVYDLVGQRFGCAKDSRCCSCPQMDGTPRVLLVMDSQLHG